MLGNQPYFFQTIPKIIAAFGFIFNDVSIQRIDPNDGSIKTIKVPIEWAAKEEWVQRLLSDPNAGNVATQKHVDIVLPRMSYNLTNLNFDPDRKISPIGFRVGVSSNNASVLKQFNSIPMIFDFSLYIRTKTIMDSLAIIEQIIPFFHPDYTIPILEIPELGLRRDIIFTRIGTPSRDDEFEGNMLDGRVITWQFDFQARGNVYPPIKEKKLITEADISVVTGGDVNFPDFTVVNQVNPPTITADQPFDVLLDGNINN